MTIRENLDQMDATVAQGAIVEAVQTHFADYATTKDYGGGSTSDKASMIAKMEDFAGAIAAVNGITHHHSVLDGNVSASEFTFDFDMKDGSKIFWHEIIRRIWDDEGKVIQEEYFNAA